VGPLVEWPHTSRYKVPDLAGHERYLKTTLYGLTSGAPSCVILVIGANAGVIGMSKEHLAVALALSVPIVVCITKVSKNLSELLGIHSRVGS
jgi:GTPase